jgi:branched-chain amino acid transport system permease protein
MKQMTGEWHKKARKFILPITLMLFLALLPLFYMKPLIVHILILANLYAIFSSSWDIVYGYAGQVSLGHALFFGGSAYLTAFLTTWYGLPQYLCIIISCIVMVGSSLLIGLPSLKLKGPYLALLTLAFSEATRATLIALPQVTGGEEGFRTIGLPGGIVHYYYITFITMLITIVCLYYIAEHRLKLFFIALREDEEAAEASGVNTTKYKLLAFMVSALFSAIGGGLYVYYIRVAIPSMLSLDTQLIATCSVIIGGSGTIFGPFIGAYVITFLSQLLTVFIPKGAVLIYATITFICVILFPKGIYGILLQFHEKFHK